MVRSAVIKSGGKQYRVSVGDTLMVEKLPGEVGDRLELTSVLMVRDGEQLYWGNPYLEGTKVIAQVIQQGRGKKIIVFKHKRRKGYRKKQGHRQSFTKVKIEEIMIKGRVSTDNEKEERMVEPREDTQVLNNQEKDISAEELSQVPHSIAEIKEEENGS
jgi:large subunit ribosomal protein L21